VAEEEAKTAEAAETEAAEQTPEPAEKTEEPAPAEGKWEPRIVAFVCNWCTYLGMDLAGTSRMKYQPNVRVVKVPCSARIDPLFVVKAFENGADGVLVSGCHPGDCHYNTGNYHARRRWTVFRELFDFLGLDLNRLQFSWVSAAEGVKWVNVINEVTDKVRELGPHTDYHNLSR
jgi:F420-non-reducing hydrogenase iron-sulfur subunit